MVVAEAALSGLPVVAYDEGGYCEWLRDKANTFLFRSNAEAVDYILGLQKNF
jgi:glycosyltransferase involved in cell wall biosynthesis